MKRNQLLLLGGALLLVVVLFVFGNTIPPKKNTASNAAATAESNAPKPIVFDTLLAKAKLRLNSQLLQQANLLQQQTADASTPQQRLKAYQQLADFWKNSGRIYEPYAYYFAQAAKLENSEKSLTFAAHQFLDNLMVEGDPAMQQWLATNAKVLFEQAISVNPNNDSSKIGLGACYILGGISNNPMQGILPVKAIAEKNPKNVYAQFILGLGGKKSAQYDKAIERFGAIVTIAPDNLEAKLHLAECYDLKGDKSNAVKWYTEVKNTIKNVDAQKELEQRIRLLKQ